MIDMLSAVLIIIVIIGLGYIYQQSRMQPSGMIKESFDVSGISILDDNHGKIQKKFNNNYSELENKDSIKPGFFLDPIYWYNLYNYNNRNKTIIWNDSPGYLSDGKPITSDQIVQGKILMNTAI